MQSLYIYKLSSPPSLPPPDHRFSLHPYACNAGPLSGSLVPKCYSPSIQCLSRVRHSAGHVVLFQSHNSPVRWHYYISYYRRDNRSLSEWDLTVGSGRAEIPAGSEPLGAAALGLVQRAHGLEEILRKKFCFWAEGWRLPSSPEYLLSFHSVESIAAHRACEKACGRRQEEAWLQAMSQGGISAWWWRSWK